MIVTLDPTSIPKAMRDSLGEDLYGHTDPETTTIYAPPQLEEHVAALASGFSARTRHRERNRAGNGWQSRLAEKRLDA